MLQLALASLNVLIGDFSNLFSNNDLGNTCQSIRAVMGFSHPIHVH